MSFLKYIEKFLLYIDEKMLHIGVRRYLENLSWMFFGRIVTMLISFAAVAYIARGLGPSNYGELSYAISYTSLFGFIASLGIEQVLYRELLARPEKRGVLMSTALVLRMAAGTFAAFLGISLAFLISSPQLSILLIVILSTSFFFSTFHLLGQEFQADVRSKLPSLLAIIVTLTLNVLKILVIAFDQGVLYLAVVLALEPILFGIGYFWMRTKYYGPINLFVFDKTLARIILVGSLPLTFVSAFSMIYARIDQVLINHMINTTSVGIYDAAVRLSEVWYFIPNIIVAGLFPALMNAKKGSLDLFMSRAKKLILYITLLSITVALFTTLIANSIVSIVFGAEFISAATVLQIYIWSNIGIGINLVIHYILIAEKMNIYIVYSTFAGMVVNVLLNIILIPVLGIHGAALASAIAYGIPFITLLFFKKTRLLIMQIFAS
ncbi:hypothetical protein CL644_02095 [bacterium]|nr:hypothetical protein [bacterium]|tara:strand:+ start:12758 stop:14065 length:1308 start_codon:yes stop_codon:yes gene_type:complete